MAVEAITTGLAERLFVAQSELNTLKKKLPEGLGITEVVSDKIFTMISDTKTPQGILVVVNMPIYDQQNVLLKENCSILCIEDINDPGNLGTMIRTAEGAGFNGLVLSKGTVDLFHPKVVRATMGSLFRVPIFLAEDFVSEICKLKEKGFTLYAAHLQGNHMYNKEHYEGNVAILIGNEANGLTEKSTLFADVLLKIPMEGKLESLNAAVSAGILMYEVYKQKNKKPFNTVDGRC